MSHVLHFTPQQIAIAAPPGLVWQLLAAVGRGHIPGSPNRARILAQQGPQRLVIEFTSPNGKRSLTTIEEVILDPARWQMRFRHLSGPLPGTRETFTLTADGPVTLLHYQGSYRPPFGLLGQLVAPRFITPVADRLVREHMVEVQEAAEARFARSHVYARPTPAVNES